MLWAKVFVWRWAVSASRAYWLVACARFSRRHFPIAKQISGHLTALDAFAAALSRAANYRSPAIRQFDKRANHYLPSSHAPTMKLTGPRCGPEYPVRFVWAIALQDFEQ